MFTTVIGALAFKFNAFLLYNQSQKMGAGTLFSNKSSWPTFKRKASFFSSLLCMSRSPYLFLALDLHTDLESDGAGDGGSVRPLLEVVPHVHLAGQGPHLDDRLPEKVVALPRQLLPQPRLQVVILVPDPDLDAVTRVVALAETVVNVSKLSNSVD